MANTATAGTALNIRGTNYGSAIPVVISMDTVQASMDVKALVAGKMIGVVGGALQNNHASGAQTLLFLSNTTEIARRVLAAAGIWEFKDAVGSYFMKSPQITTQPGEKLALKLNDATNQPINGFLNLAVSEVWEIL